MGSFLLRNSTQGSHSFPFHLPLHSPSLQLDLICEAKRFFKTQPNKEGGKDISEFGPDQTIHSGQIFAEMLGAACHPEFFDHGDVEVPRAFPVSLTSHPRTSSPTHPHLRFLHSFSLLYVLTITGIRDLYPIQLLPPLPLSFPCGLPLLPVHTRAPSLLSTNGVEMLRTREYDFADSEERAGWFDVFVALVQYY